MAFQSTAYVYTPLSGSDKIRTLRLLSADGDRPQCTLQESSHADGEYLALSYVWGTEEKPHRAQIKDQDGTDLGSISLTENLWCAIRDIWRCDGLKHNAFWIDQICIDQNGTEKAQQVSMMAKIYRNADTVVSYLGPSKEEKLEEYGTRLMSKIHDHFEPNYAVICKLESLAGVKFMFPKFPVPKLPRELDDEVEAIRGHFGQHWTIDSFDLPDHWSWLVELTYGEWTKRLWMVQEQTLNPNLVALRGRRLLSWDAVAITTILFAIDVLPDILVLEFWKRASGQWTDSWECGGSVWSIWQDRMRRTKATTKGSRPEEYSILSQSTMRLSSFTTSIWSIWKDWIRAKTLDDATLRPTEDPNLSQLIMRLSSYDHLRCRDPRDRIFALLSISDDAQALGIEPNYSSTNTASKLFRDISVKVLQQAKELEILFLICQWDNLADNDQPSWAINVPRPLEFETNAISPRTLTIAAHPRGRLQSAPRFTNNNSTLILRGSQVDTITMATPPNYWNRSAYLKVVDESYLVSLAQTLANWASVLLQGENDLQDILDFCRVFTLSVDFSSPTNNRAAPEEILLGFWCYLRFSYTFVRQRASAAGIDVDANLRRCLEAIERFGSIFMPPGTWSPESELNPEERIAFNVMNQHAKWRGRAYGRTASGRPFSAMNAVQDGDAVVALEGSRVLWTLRPWAGKFRLIGDIWVAGLMEGEAYKNRNGQEMDIDLEII